MIQIDRHSCHNNFKIGTHRYLQHLYLFMLCMTGQFVAALSTTMQNVKVSAKKHVCEQQMVFLILFRPMKHRYASF